MRKTAKFLLRLCDKKGIVVRHSVDKFCIFLHKISDKNEVKKMLKNFYIYLEENKFSLPDGTKGTVSMSIGISWYNENSTFKGMLKGADEALYISKKITKIALKKDNINII